MRKPIQRWLRSITDSKVRKVVSRIQLPLLCKLMREAGFEGNNLPTIELLYNTSEGHQKIAEALQQMWKQTLGIDIVLTNTDWKVYLDKQNNGDYEIARAGWIGDYQDPKTFLDMMVTGRGNNQTGWSNIDYDEYLVSAANSTSQADRFSYMYEAEKMLIKAFAKEVLDEFSLSSIQDISEIALDNWINEQN